MQPQPVSLLLSLAAALSACTLGQDSASDGAPPATQDSTSSLGRVVTEIDSGVWCIHQSQNGDYWFGSNGSGAYRYDGEFITHYTEADGLQV